MGYSGFLNITYWYVSLRKGTLGQCNESNFTFKIAGRKQLRQTIPQKFNIYEKKPLYLGELYGCKNKDKERLTKAKQKTKKRRNGEKVAFHVLVVFVVSFNQLCFFVHIAHVLSNILLQKHNQS